ncbi:MAG: sarcosine oxidase subunit gamma family protein [Betaproteobacteria bacterium]
MHSLIANAPDARYWVAPDSFPIDAKGLTVCEAPWHGVIRLQGSDRDAEFGRRAAGVLGLELPAACRSANQGELTAVWVSPNERLIFCPIAQEASLVTQLRQALAECFATVTLVTDSRVGYEIRGNQATEFLAKGCSLDLDPSVFATGSVAITRFATLNCMVYRERSNAYRLYFDISYQSFVLSWILDAAAEWQ